MGTKDEILKKGEGVLNVRIDTLSEKLRERLKTLLESETGKVVTNDKPSCSLSISVTEPQKMKALTIFEGVQKSSEIQQMINEIMLEKEL